MITINGLPLLLPDTEGELADFQAQFQAMQDLQSFADETVASKSVSSITRNDAAYGVGLPLPNYTSEPAPRLNSLWWPTGASRWARGYFLATGDVVRQLQPNSFTNEPMTLVMGDDLAGATITAQMWLLPPRPISVPGTNPPANQLWLLPLVDQRYWWQFLNCGDLGLSSSTTWANLFTAIGAAIGAQIAFDTVPSAYLNPDPIELYRRNGNVAVYLDAVSASVGQRVVVGLDGSVSSQYAGTSAAVFAANQTLDLWTQVAGGDFSGMAGNVPAYCMVSYPMYRQGVAFCEGSQQTYSNSAPAGGVVTSGTTKTVHSSCFADFSSGGSSPDNDSRLSLLAQQISSDYYSWLTKQYDATANSMKAWRMCGFDNYAEWTFGRQIPAGCGGGADGEKSGQPVYLAQTRIQSMPYDFGVARQLSQDPNLQPLGHFVIGKVSGSDLSPGSGGSVVVWDTTPGSETSIGVTINNVFTWTSDTIPKDTKVWCFWHCGENCWYCFKASSTASLSIVRFKLTGTLTLGGSAPAVIQNWDSGTSAYTDGSTVTVVDVFGAGGFAAGPGEWQAPNGYYGYAVKLTDKEEYQVLYMEHQAEFAAFTLTADISGGNAACTFNSFWMGRSVGGATVVYDRQSLYGSAKSGDKGIAAWDSKLGQYVIIDMGKGGSADLTLFYLNANLSQGGSASATIRQWAAGAWNATGTNITVYDSSNLGPAASSKLGVCFLSSQSGRYEIVALPGSGSGIVRFQLTAGLPWGGSATANTLTWTGSSYTVGTSITVNDFTTGGSFSGIVGMQGVAVLLDGVYEIIEMQKIARRVEWSAVQQMAKSELATVVNATLFYDGIAPIAVPGALQVWNSRNIFQCDYSTKGVAVYKPELAIYEIDWATCASNIKPSSPAAPDYTQSSGSNNPGAVGPDLASAAADPSTQPSPQSGSF